MDDGSCDLAGRIESEEWKYFVSCRGEKMTARRVRAAGSASARSADSGRRDYPSNAEERRECNSQTVRAGANGRMGRDPLEEADTRVVRVGEELPMNPEQSSLVVSVNTT
jgi:chromosome condensin MukBEF MukE localization factor